MATSYSIKIEGTKRSVNQSSLTSDNLLAGVNIPVEVGSGAKIRGQVMAGGTKKMVWIPKEIGSNIPRHWEEEGSSAASARNSSVHSRRDMEQMTRGNPNMLDPLGPPKQDQDGKTQPCQSTLASLTRIILKKTYKN